MHDSCVKNTVWRVSLLAIAAATLLVIAGCRAVGPTYKAPVPRVPDAWSVDIAKSFERGEPSLQEWWKTLHDPVLEELIQRARGSNLTVKQALSVIREARYRRGVVFVGLQPKVDIGASYARTLASENTPPFNSLPPDLRHTEPVNFYQVGFDMAWELDVFGGIRRQIEAADAGVGVAEEAYRDVLVTLFGEVAASYVDIRTLQQRIAYAEGNVQAQRETLELVRARYDAGLVGQLDVEQAESNLANTESTLPLLRQSLSLNLNLMAVLLGEPPGALQSELRKPAPLPVAVPQLAVGLPADLVRQRPDVRRAERNLASQVAQIGVLTSDLYPHFGLSGNLGFESVDFLNPGKGVTYTIAPFVKWNVFNRGRIKGNISAQEEVTQQALLGYEQNVLVALAEVESTMVAYREERKRHVNLTEAVSATVNATDLVKTLYTNGLTDFQNVLDTERFLSTQQDQLATSEGQELKYLVALYKALGGGWSPQEAIPDGPATKSSLRYQEK
jgi:multidrug efflux system outer membrane protein